MTQTTSTVSNQVMWNRMISVVEEQAQALIRTAFSPSVREAGDLSGCVMAAFLNSQGRLHPSRDSSPLVQEERFHLVADEAMIGIGRRDCERTVL